jgi:hypothetical protein
MFGFDALAGQIFMCPASGVAGYWNPIRGRTDCDPGLSAPLQGEQADALYSYRRLP